MPNEIHRIKRNGKLEYRCYNTTIDAYLVNEPELPFDSLEACIEHLASIEAKENTPGCSEEERITWWREYLADYSRIRPDLPPHWGPVPLYDLDSFIELVDKLSKGEEKIEGLKSSELELFREVARYLKMERELDEKQPSKNFDFDRFWKVVHRLLGGSEGMVVEDVMEGRRKLTRLEITLWGTLRYLINVERIYRDV
jgi:hypothetical protein